MKRTQSLRIDVDVVVVDIVVDVVVTVVINIYVAILGDIISISGTNHGIVITVVMIVIELLLLLLLLLSGFYRRQFKFNHACLWRHRIHVH